VHAKQESKSSSNEVNDLQVKIASLFYVHTPRLVYDIECCLKDFKRFHARLMEDVADKAANMALDILKKGQTYLTKTLAELYQQEDEGVGNNGVDAAAAEAAAALAMVKEKVAVYKIKFLLETPVIAIPIDKRDFSSFFVAHLGQIHVKNVTAADEQQTAHSQQRSTNKKLTAARCPQDTTNFQIMLKNMSMFSIDTRVELEELARTMGGEAGGGAAVFSLAQLASNKTTFFQIFYKPCKQQNLIDKTNMDMSVSYLPSFKNGAAGGDQSTESAAANRKGIMIFISQN
jgi:hypothetical protein